MTALDFYVAIRQAQCALDARCAAVRGRGWTGTGDCLNALNSDDEAHQAQLGFNRQQWVDATFELPADTAQLLSCLDRLNTMACDTRVVLKCLDLMQGGVDQGEPCGPPTYPACRAGLYCDSSTPGCFTCQPKHAVGEPCGQGAQGCLSGWCGGVGGTQCVEAMTTWAFPGESPTLPFGRCAVGNADGAYDFSSGVAVCAQPGLENQPCAGGRCVQPLFCNASQTCVRPLADGAPCDRSEPHCEHACIFTSATAPTGTCGPLLPAPVNGEPCANGSYCAPGVLPSTTFSGGCVCVLQTDGDSCVNLGTLPRGRDNACPSGACLMGQLEDRGLCGPAQALDAPCQRNTDCGSGLCTMAPGATAPTCQAPMCPAPPDCSNITNTSMATATDVPLDVAFNLPLCGVDTWWKLPGSWQPPDGAVVLQTGSLGTPLAQIDFAFLSGGSPFFNNTQNVYIFSQYYPVDGPDVYLRVHPNDPTHQMETVLVSRAGADVCPGSATNTTEDTAPIIQLGTPVQGLFCSMNMTQDFYWRVNGPFLADDALRVDTVYEFPQPNGRSGFIYGYNGGGARNGDGTGFSLFNVAADGPYATVIAGGNPSYRASEHMTFTVTRDPDPGFTCASPPTNLARRNAIPLVVGQQLTAHGCATFKNRNAYFHLPGSFASGTRLRLTLGLGAGTGLTGYGYVLVWLPGSNGQLLSQGECAFSSVTCDFVTSQDANGIYLSFQENQLQGTEERDFTLQVDLP